MRGGASFSARLIAWQRRHGRKDLPWQGTRDPYRIWLSEVMLQQTQVSAVIPYYERFLKRFPDISSLAAAEQDDVLRLWSGLGYYARGRNLHAASRRVALDLKGKFPDTALDIETLPGVGRSTAAAIAAFAFGERAAILDGNVKRVLARCYAIPDEKNLWQKAEQLLPRRNIETYTQALMDLGATVCVRARPRCEACPVRAGCVARQTERIAEFPAPRARPVLPTRKATWYVLRHAGRVLLEKRPGAGLWGGLWTFPESLDGVRVGKKERLKPLEHGFTHFRLRVQPMLCEVARIPARAESPGRRWLELGEARAAAVPTPVRRILTSLAAR